jgi:hypothetical protein
MDGQMFLIFKVSSLGWNFLAGTHNQHIGSLDGEKGKRHGPILSLKMSIKGASTIFGIASCVIQVLCYSIYP